MTASKVDTPVETLRLRREGAVLFADIGAPPMNLLGPELVRDLVLLIERAEADDTVQVLVFRSADPDYFISHVDVTRIDEYRAEAAKLTGEASIAVLLRYRSAPPMRLDVCVDPSVQRDGVIAAGVPAVHQIVARVQALRAYGIGTLGVAHEFVDSWVGACHLTPNTIKPPRCEQAPRAGDAACRQARSRTCRLIRRAVASRSPRRRRRGVEAASYPASRTAQLHRR